MCTVTVQVLEPVTATLRLYQPLPEDPADRVAVQLPDPPPPPEEVPWLTGGAGRRNAATSAGAFIWRRQNEHQSPRSERQ